MIYKDSIEGTLPRKKIRIRTYSSNFFEDTNKFNYEIKISSVEGRYKTSNKLIKNINNIFNGIFDNQYGMCYPVLNVIYEREYYIQNKSRVTIDAIHNNIVGIPITHLSNVVPPPAPIQQSVIENISSILSIL